MLRTLQRRAMKPLPSLFHTVAALALLLLSSDRARGFSRSNLPQTTKPFARPCDAVGGRPRCAPRPRGAQATKLSSATGNDGDNGAIDAIKSNPAKAACFSSLMALCGATLGPFLDSYHSLFGVLSYETPLTFPLVTVGDSELLTCVTTYWVPPLFGLAGFLIGWLYILLDSVLVVEGTDADPSRSHSQLHPSVPKVLVGISYFTFQYWLSGILSAHGTDRTSVLAIMSALAAGGFLALDGTPSGLVTSAATAIGGPLIEVGLISSLAGPWAYHYNDAGETGFFPLWIVPVYFLGGPANGNLARAFWNALGEDEKGE